MTEIKVVRDDEKATAILKAIRQIDDGEELAPVVRCEKCTFWDTEGCPMRETPGDMLWSDFCSYGERREGT